MAGLIKAFKRQTCTQSTIANDRNDLTRWPSKRIGFHHTERRGDGSTCVAGAKDIVFALFTTQKSAQAVQLANGSQPSSPPADQFMGVRLMPCVPNDAIFRCVENIVKGKRQLHRTECGCEVSSHFRHDGDHFFSYFRCQSREL